MLEIQNIYKIIGEELNCKWLPNTKGWVVKTVEDVGDTYCFGLENGSIDGMEAQIQLRREPVIRDGVIKYEMWAWNSDNNPEVLWRTKADLMTVRDGMLWIGYILDKMLPVG